jgi:hypothetical protein
MSSFAPAKCWTVEAIVAAVPTADPDVGQLGAATKRLEQWLVVLAQEQSVWTRRQLCWQELVGSDAILGRR